MEVPFKVSTVFSFPNLPCFLFEMLLVLCCVLPHWTNSHLKSSVLNSVSFLSSVLRSQIWHPKKKEQEQDVCVCVLLSTGYFSCQSQQELTVKRIRVGDAKHGQIHFINHKLACLPALGNSHNNIILFASSWKKKSHLSHKWRAPCENAPLIFAHFESSSKLLQATFV